MHTGDRENEEEEEEELLPRQLKLQDFCFYDSPRFNSLSQHVGSRVMSV